MIDLSLIHGDCLKVLPTLTDKSVDAIITDLPYGTTACKWDVIIPLEKLIKLPIGGKIPSPYRFI